MQTRELQRLHTCVLVQHMPSSHDVIRHAIVDDWQKLAVVEHDGNVEKPIGGQLGQRRAVQVVYRDGRHRPLSDDKVHDVFAQIVVRDDATTHFRDAPTNGPQDGARIFEVRLAQSRPDREELGQVRGPATKVQPREVQRRPSHCPCSEAAYVR